MLKSNDYVISDLFIRSFIIIIKHYELNDCLECDVCVLFPSSYFLKLANFSNFI